MMTTKPDYRETISHVRKPWRNRVIHHLSTEIHGLPSRTVACYVEGAALQTYSEAHFVGDDDDPNGLTEKLAIKMAGDKLTQVNRRRIARGLGAMILAGERSSMGRLPEDNR